ncbi:MAG: ribonuclease P protein component [Micavibrio sp.]|nr:ribonuclease P protein component [Micavibrio sp.]
MCAAVPTLKASPEFQRISRQGKKWVCPAFIMLVLPLDDTAPFRLGLTVSRKVGNAVVRNRAKRRLREMVRLFIQARAPKGFDVILISKTAAASIDFDKMSQDFIKGLTHLKVLS